MNFHTVQQERETASIGILDRATRAFALAQCAVGETAVVLATQSESALRNVECCERDLDSIDRETDASIAEAIAEASSAESRILLACLKFIIDLERLGDLLSSVAFRCRESGPYLPMEDVGELLRMCCILERMVAEAHRAYANRSIDQAISILRMDLDLDRLRDLILGRHLEQAVNGVPRHTVQVLFMAQSLERAGDHVKNVAEEVCHLISGRSIRHFAGTSAQVAEQINLNWPTSVDQNSNTARPNS